MSHQFFAQMRQCPRRPKRLIHKNEHSCFHIFQITFVRVVHLCPKLCLIRTSQPNKYILRKQLYQEQCLQIVDCRS